VPSETIALDSLELGHVEANWRVAAEVGGKMVKWEWKDCVEMM